MLKNGHKIDCPAALILSFCLPQKDPEDLKCSHLEQSNGFFNLDESVGRRLDFLLQEFLREVNTIASKINHAETAHLIVGMKNDLEKIREQVQNLEEE